MATIALLARRWGGPAGGRDGMSIAVSYLAWTLAQMGHRVICYLSADCSPPWQHPLVEWRQRQPLCVPDNWSADLVISTISPAWRRTVIAAQQAGAVSRLIYWHHHGSIPPGYGCTLARVADTGEPAKGWSREIILPPSSWAAGEGGERVGKAIVVPGISQAKGGRVALAVAQQLRNIPWYVLPGRAAEPDVTPWKSLGHVVIAPPGLSPATWLAQALLVFSPSRAETYGLAMVEAAVRGIPVVTSDLPGPRFALRDVAKYLPLDAPAASWISAIRGMLAQEPQRLSLPAYSDTVQQSLGLRSVPDADPTAAAPVQPAALEPRVLRRVRRRALAAVAAKQARQESQEPPVVTVSMSYYHTPETVVRAVESVLNQTERRLRLVVVNDGDDPAAAWAPLAHVNDPRLFRLDLPENKGTYHAHAVTLAACDTPWWMPHDSDDWSDPGRLSELLAAADAASADVAVGTTILHPLGAGTMRTQPPPASSRRSRTRGIDHPVHWSALWGTEWLRSIGGPHPGYRLGYDSVLVSLAYACGRVQPAPAAHYHREQRPGSLWSGESTCRNSPARRRAWDAVLKLLEDARERLAAGAGPDDIGSRIRASIQPELAAEVEQQAERLRKLTSSGPATILLPAPSAPRRASVSVAIPTCDRPAGCLAILQDLAQQTFVGDLRVTVYLDGGDEAAYYEVQAFCEARGWRLVLAPARLGKRGYWRTVNKIWAGWRSAPADYLVYLADDLRLLPTGIERMIAEWKAIPDRRKAALNLLRDAARSGKACWTGIRPVRCSHVDRVGWVDCIFLAVPSALAALGWEIKPIPESRWAADPTLSSGVGEQMSKRLLAAGRTLYQAGRSIVDHLGHDSQMNPRTRAATPMRAIGYGPVLASLASIPCRVEALRQVVASLLPQVDRLRVYLNGYDAPPRFLQHPKIEFERSQDHGDLGDAGKFFWCGLDRSADAWLLTCDDDLVYPPDYSRTMVEASERYGRRALVSAHGCVLKFPIASYYRSRMQHHCLHRVASDAPVHILGTGALCYHSGAVDITPADFRAPNMADVWLALATQRQRVPCVAVAHGEGWIRDIPSTRSSGIYRHSAHGTGEPADTGRLQTEVVKGWSPWVLLSPAGEVLSEAG